MCDHSEFRSPLTRYITPEMSYNFSAKNRIETWRKLWFYLAKGQQSVGFQITDEQLTELENNIGNINFERASEYEKNTRHDVMAHIHTYAEICPKAKPIIHLGATSCYVTDNADLILIKSAFKIIIKRILRLIKELSIKIEKYKSLPTLAYTHFQPAQLTTMGKRIAFWLQDITMDYENILHACNKLKFRGVKGTVGTQDSFLNLFNGDYDKVEELDKYVTTMAGFSKSYTLTCQTYTRKVDMDCLSTLASLGATIHKICLDIRLLSGLNEISEPFGEFQVGSSAMPYKKNPIRSERCCGLARHLASLYMDSFQTASLQMLERSLDDSSSRRISIPESFIVADIIVHTLINIVNGLEVYPAVIKKNIEFQMPFLASEKIIVEMVKLGCNRDECHEKLRLLSMETIKRMKIDGLDNNFVDCILNDNFFKPIHHVIKSIFDPSKFIGCVTIQIDKFLNETVAPILNNNSHLIDNNDHKLYI